MLDRLHERGRRRGVCYLPSFEKVGVGLTHPVPDRCAVAQVPDGVDVWVLGVGQQLLPVVAYWSRHDSFHLDGGEGYAAGGAGVQYGQVRALRSGQPVSLLSGALGLEQGCGDLLGKAVAERLS